jgi:hypothetical protein
MADDQFSIIFSILFFAMLKKSKDKKYKTKQKKYEKTVEKILPNSNWNSTDSREKKSFTLVGSLELILKLIACETMSRTKTIL